MGHISKGTTKRLVVLYLVGKFADGVYGNIRFQKVLYYGERDADLRPFTYRYTDFGQFSSDARDTLEQLASVGYIEVTELQRAKHSSAKWKLADTSSVESFAHVLHSVSPHLKTSIDSSIQKYGYMKEEDLETQAHDDPILQRIPRGEVILQENLPHRIQTDLTTEECAELELALNPEFIAAMEKIVDGWEKSDFDVGEVQRSASFL